MFAVILDPGTSKFITRVYLGENEAIEFCDKCNRNGLGFKYTYHKIPVDLWFNLENEVLKGI